MARSRALLGGAASGPDSGELAVLRIWPSARGRVGIRLQTAISLGARRSDVMAMLPVLLAWDTRSWSDEDHALAQDFGGYFVRDFDLSFVKYFARYFGRYLVRDFARYFVRDLGNFGRYFARNFGQDFIRYFGRDFVRYFVRDFVRYFGRDFVVDFGRYFARDFARYFGRDFVPYFVRDLGLPEAMLGAPWLPGFAFLDVGSAFGRAAPRSALAHGKLPKAAPLLALFRAACEASFEPGNARLRTALVHSSDAFVGDPLWPALARHIARISTATDRALLEDLARHPEQRRAPISWGLQHYVRGDLVFPDGSVVSLDELCTQADLEPPPLLESMPDELDIQLVEDSP